MDMDSFDYYIVTYCIPTKIPLDSTKILQKLNKFSPKNTFFPINYTSLAYNLFSQLPSVTWDLAI